MPKRNTPRVRSGGSITLRHSRKAPDCCRGRCPSSGAAGCEAVLRERLRDSVGIVSREGEPSRPSPVSSKRRSAIPGARRPRGQQLEVRLRRAEQRVRGAVARVLAGQRGAPPSRRVGALGRARGRGPRRSRGRGRATPRASMPQPCDSDRLPAPAECFARLFSHLTRRRHTPAEARGPLGLPHLLRAQLRAREQRALPHEPRARARPASRSPSICRRRPATTPTTRSRAARSARSACRSPRRGHGGRCSSDIPLDQMNTSMTINATASWLLALYVAVAERQGVAAERARGHDAERHRQGVPLARDVRLPARALAPPDHATWSPTASTRSRSGTRSTSAPTTSRRRARRRRRRSPSRSPTRSRCSTRCARAPTFPPTRMPRVFGRISFFLNAGIRFVEEICKTRAMARALGRDRARALRRRRRARAPLPLRRAGELPRASPRRSPRTT